MLTNTYNQQNLSHQFRLVTRAAVLFLVVGLLGGCVSSSSYDDVSKERDELIKRERALASNTQYLRNKSESNEEKAARLKAELDSAQIRLNDVNESL
ncbi:hypothetical protein KA005_37110, partial [bacterium]|nr:hypothetical protein [bacterium]